MNLKNRKWFCIVFATWYALFKKQTLWTLNYTLENCDYIPAMLGLLPSAEGVHSTLDGSSLPHAKTWPPRNSSAWRELLSCLDCTKQRRTRAGYQLCDVTSCVWFKNGWYVGKLWQNLTMNSIFFYVPTIYCMW